MPDPSNWSETSDPLAAFADWFLAQPLIALRPPVYGVHFYGDLMSVILYRDEEYQAELFIVRPDASERCGEHGHPDIDSMEVAISGELYFTLNGRPIRNRKRVRAVSPDGALATYGEQVRVRPGEPHTAYVGQDGGCFLSLQRWLNGVKPSSIGLNWSGEEHAGKFKERYQKETAVC